jgi:hypothetical protein
MPFLYLTVFEVASEMTGHSKEQYKKRYRIADTVVHMFSVTRQKTMNSGGIVLSSHNGNLVHLVILQFYISSNSYPRCRNRDRNVGYETIKREYCNPYN